MLGSIMQVGEGAQAARDSLQAMLSAQDSVIQLLNAQLAITTHYDASLLQTVYWSLGTLAVIAAALIGFGWFANFRVYERDKIALSERLSAEVRERIAELREVNRSEIAAALKEVREAAGKAAALVVAGPVKSLHDDVLDIRYELAVREAADWKAQKVFGNQLTQGLAAARLAQERAWDYRLSAALEIMVDALKNGARVNAQDAQNVFSFLDSLAPSFAADAENIREAVRNARRG